MAANVITKDSKCQKFLANLNVRTTTTQKGKNKQLRCNQPEMWACKKSQKNQLNLFVYRQEWRLCKLK